MFFSAIAQEKFSSSLCQMAQPTSHSWCVIRDGPIIYLTVHSLGVNPTPFTQAFPSCVIPGTVKVQGLIDFFQRLFTKNLVPRKSVTSLSFSVRFCSCLIVLVLLFPSTHVVCIRGHCIFSGIYRRGSCDDPPRPFLWQLSHLPGARLARA